MHKPVLMWHYRKKKKKIHSTCIFCFSILDHSISIHGNSELWHHRHLIMSLRGMECDINSNRAEKLLKNEIGEINFHRRFGCFLQIGLSHDFHWSATTTEENEFVSSS